MRMVTAAVLLGVTALASPVLAQQGAQGGAAPSTTLSQKQADCRRQADDKGLRGPAHRKERQAFMQSCVHGK